MEKLRLGLPRFPYFVSSSVPIGSRLKLAMPSMSLAFSPSFSAQSLAFYAVSSGSAA